MQGAITPVELLEQNMEQEREERSGFSLNKDLLQTIFQEFYSETNKEQKSNLSSINIEGLIGIDARNVYLEKIFGFKDRVAEAVKEKVLTTKKSQKGWGTKTLIEWTQSLGTQIQTQQPEEGFNPGRLIRK